MKGLIILAFVLILHHVQSSVQPTSNSSGNYLRVALGGREDSDPSQNRRRSNGEFHSVYDKGPVVPGAGVRTQHFFIAEDYTVYDGLRERVIPFFDPEKLINCDCDLPFPAELDIPYRFVLYNPVTVQAPLPDVPKDLDTIKYTGFYYACPVNTNPFEFAWYRHKQRVNPCKWMWYQSVEDSGSNLSVAEAMPL